MKNKLIGLVSNDYWTLYKFRYDIIQMLIRKGYKIILIANKDKYHKKFNNENISKHFIPLKDRSINIFSEIKTIINLYKIYKKSNFDLIFHFTLKPNVYGGIIARFLNIKTISMITGLGYIFIKPNKLLKALVVKMLKFSIKNSKEVWFTNTHDLGVYQKLNIIKSQQTKLIPGAGADFSNKILKISNKDNKYNFLMVSRLLIEKGVEDFIDSAMYFKNNPNITFTLVGTYKKNDENYIRENTLDYVIENKVISYYPYSNKINDFFQKATCLIHPSYREGLSTVLLEAAVHRIPIITTKVPGCIDIILNDEYGFLCEKKNPQSIIENIKKLISTEKANLSKKTETTYQHVKNNFDRALVLKVFEHTVDVYVPKS